MHNFCSGCRLIPTRGPSVVGTAQRSKTWLLLRQLEHTHAIPHSCSSPFSSGKVLNLLRLVKRPTFAASQERPTPHPTLSRAMIYAAAAKLNLWVGSVALPQLSRFWHPSMPMKDHSTLWFSVKLLVGDGRGVTPGFISGPGMIVLTHPACHPFHLLHTALRSGSRSTD